ncbi:MAG TPA: glycosyltransferase [Thermoanaerobaculia bacterium]|jgi:spore maturation protein CgeB|nr:glycosyltransferase [Thermoanaerobaculia bacterium]
MKVVFFVHSLLSDWNHGNAHFLRGVVTELLARGHAVDVWEPREAWSVTNLLADAGPSAIDAFRRAYPQLASHRYDGPTPSLERALDGADLVLVHEWNSAELVAAVGRHRAESGSFRLLFHDTHHRAVTAPEEMAAYDLRHYDGVLAFGESIREQYLRHGWAERIWTWHEAADVRIFHPLPRDPEGDVVWIGNWGDEERSAELRELLIEPVRALHLSADVHGVRYPEEAVRLLRASGIDYHGWLPNFLAPEAFARHRVTMHVPRRPYVEALPGVPTIRVFEALACGIPLLSAPWHDSEHLFTPGRDFLVAHNGAEMQQRLRQVLHEPACAEELRQHGLETIRARHTCAHRVDELLAIAASMSDALAAKA